MGIDLQSNTQLSPGVQVMLPFLYAAWADQHLNLKEINSLRQQAGHFEFLTEEDKAVLRGWSDPLHPPTRELSQHWRTLARNVVEQLPADRPASLAELGALMGKMAENGGPDREGYWKTQVAPLLEIERGLGGVEEETYRGLFPQYDQREQLKEAVRKASVEPTAYQAILDGQYAEIIARTKRILLRPEFKRETLRMKEDYRERVLEWCKTLGQEGIGALAFPEAYGGEGNMGKYAYVFEVLGYHDLSMTIKFGVQFGLWGGAIVNLGTKRHHDKYLYDTGTMDLPGCFAMTETGHGSNVRGLETTAVYDHDNRELIVHSPSLAAGKEYIGNALHSRMAAVFCQLIVDGESQGVHSVVVPVRNEAGETLPGIRVEDNGYKMGLNGIDNGRLWFNRVRVPVENLLDRFGGITEEGRYHSEIENPSRRFFTMLGTLVGGRVFVPRAGMSATKAALAIAVRYGLRRRQFAPDPLKAETIIMDYPNQQRRLIPLVAKAYATQFGLDYLLERYVNRSEDEMREIEALAAGLKSYATWFTTAAIQECREATGGKGYLAENRFATLKADTDIFTTFEGDNNVLMQLVAKSLLAEFKKEFKEDGNFAVLRYMGQRVQTIVMEQNAYTIRQTDRKHLTSRAFFRTAFDFRARRLVSTLAQRLRAYIKEGMSAYEAGLRCQTHMIEAAEAHIEAIILEQAIERVQALDKGNPAREVLKKVNQLFALHTIEGHRGWYLESGYIAANKSKAIRKAVDVLCAELRPEVGALVDGFGIPDELLAAPIAVA